MSKLEIHLSKGQQEVRSYMDAVTDSQLTTDSSRLRLYCGLISRSSSVFTTIGNNVVVDSKKFRADLEQIATCAKLDAESSNMFNKAFIDRACRIACNSILVRELARHYQAEKIKKLDVNVVQNWLEQGTIFIDNKEIILGITSVNLLITAVSKAGYFGSEPTGQSAKELRTEQLKKQADTRIRKAEARAKAKELGQDTTKKKGVVVDAKNIVEIVKAVLAQSFANKEYQAINRILSQLAELGIEFANTPEVQNELKKVQNKK